MLILTYMYLTASGAQQANRGQDLKARTDFDLVFNYDLALNLNVLFNVHPNFRLDLSPLSTPLPHHSMFLPPSFSWALALLEQGRCQVPRGLGGPRGPLARWTAGRFRGHVERS